MAKIQINSEKLTPFGGIFSIMEQFDALLSQTIDSTLGLRCKLYGYQYSEIFRSLMCVYFCGGTCIEDVSTHLMKHLSLHPRLRTCSADTILRAIEELTCKNTTYFYKAIILKMDVKKFGLKSSSRIKTFVFKFVSVPAKWIRMARQNILNIYTDNEAYARVFKTDFG